MRGLIIAFPNSDDIWQALADAKRPEETTADCAVRLLRERLTQRLIEGEPLPKMLTHSSTEWPPVRPIVFDPDRLKVASIRFPESIT